LMWLSILSQGSSHLGGNEQTFGEEVSTTSGSYADSLMNSSSRGTRQSQNVASIRGYSNAKQRAIISRI